METVKQKKYNTDEMCPVHFEFVELMTSLSVDLKWIVKVGKWFLMLVGSILLMVIPLGISLLNNLTYMQSKLEVGLTKIDGFERMVAKQEREFIEMKENLLKYRSGR